MIVTVARIGKAHGLRGEVTVELRSDDPQARFAVGNVLDTKAARGSGVPRALTVRSARRHNGIWLVAFDEIPDRTGAESLRGTLLQYDADTDDATEDDEEGWYEHELVGLPVVDQTGTTIGEVVALHTRTAQDLLEVKHRDGRTGLIPFVEAIVPVVDVPGRRIVIDAPDGLFDLDEA